MVRHGAKFRKIGAKSTQPRLCLAAYKLGYAHGY
jgi:hypothetical protein